MSTALANQPQPQTRQGLTSLMASKYSMEPAKFAQTIKATCMPGNATDEEFMAFMMVAQEYNLNPIVRHIYAFPKKGGGIQPIVSIDGWIKLVQDHKDYDGIEFEPVMDNVNDKVVAMTCRIYRKSMSRPTQITEYLAECKRQTEPWNQWPMRMLRHKALIQCARVAFGYAGVMDEEEGESIKAVPTAVVESAPTSRTEQLKQRLMPAPKPFEDHPAQQAPEPEPAPAPAPAPNGSKKPGKKTTKAAELPPDAEDLTPPAGLLGDERPEGYEDELEGNGADAIKGR